MCDPHIPDEPPSEGLLSGCDAPAARASAAEGASSSATVATAAAKAISSSRRTGLNVTRQQSLEFSCLKDTEIPMVNPIGPSSAPCFSAAATAAAHRPSPPSGPHGGTHKRPDPLEFPEGAPAARGEFELPLLLLQSSTDTASMGGTGGPPGGPPVGDEWRQEVSASVAAAFRDLQSNMHLRSSNSRAMRIGLGEMLLMDGSEEFGSSSSSQLNTERQRGLPPAGPGGAPQAPQGGPQRLPQKGVQGPSAAAAPKRVSPRSEGGPPAAEGPKGPPEEAPEEVVPSEAAIDRARMPPPVGPPLSAAASVGRGPQEGAAEAEGPPAEEEAPERVMDIQTEFLSAFNIPPDQAAAIAEAAEAAAAEAGDSAATTKIKALAMPRAGTSSSFSPSSLGGPQAAPQRTTAQAQAGGGAPTSSPSEASTS